MLAEQALGLGQLDNAKSLFASVVDTRAVSEVEYHIARIELQRLG